MDKLKLDIQMFSNDEEEKIYGFDDNGCKYPVYTKEEINNLVIKKENIVKCSNSITLGAGAVGSLEFSYPTGFTKNNSYIVSYKWSEEGGYEMSNSGYKGATSDMEIYPTFIPKSNKIICSIYNFRNQQSTYNIEFILLKVE